MSKQGLIYKSTGSWYDMRDEDGRMWKARVKGKLKIDKNISSSNPIAVGDTVLYDVEDEAANTVMIRDVADRRNYIVRVSPQNRNQKHIISANLDAALVVATIKEPRTSQGFIDRFLITAEAYHVPSIIVVNKMDLLIEKDEEQYRHWERQFTTIGYEIFPIIALKPESLQKLSNRLKNCTTLFSGHSGVGKSTLINQLIPTLGLRTTEVSEWSGKGQHTTTFAEMFDLPEGGKIIDTPGVKEFGLIDIKKHELSQYFPEMRAVMHDCKFNNCLHINEPDCAVKDALNDGRITVDRYVSYRSILDSIEEKYR